MPLLVADIGNAHTVLGLLEPAGSPDAGGTVTDHWRIATDERRTADEWAVLLRGLLGRRQADLDGIAVCSTVPAVLHEWRDMLTGHFGDLPHVVVEPGVRTGIPVLVDNPREVGSDRILNALAAVTLLGGPAVVRAYFLEGDPVVADERLVPGRPSGAAAIGFVRDGAMDLALEPGTYDVVLSNPPFHIDRADRHDLGKAFILSAARGLKPNGQLWMVANRHLPYEETLNGAFKNVTVVAENGYYKVFRAIGPKKA